MCAVFLFPFYDALSIKPPMFSFFCMTQVQGSLQSSLAEVPFKRNATWKWAIFAPKLVKEHHATSTRLYFFLGVCFSCTSVLDFDDETYLEFLSPVALRAVPLHDSIPKIQQEYVSIVKTVPRHLHLHELPHSQPLFQNLSRHYR